MSKFVNFSIKAFGVGLLLLFGALSFIDLNHGLIRFDWTPYKKLFTESEKKGAWTTVERDTGFYPPGLDKRWAQSVLSSLQVKVSLREPIKKNEENLDFAYEAQARLTRPILSDEYSGYEVDYRIDFVFKFIDEDGFVIESVNAYWFNPSHSHEKYGKNDLTYVWGDQEKENITKILLDGKIDHNIAKRTKKITYEPSIKLTDSRLAENKKIN